MSTLKVENLQHKDAVSPNLVLNSDGTITSGNVTANNVTANGDLSVTGATTLGGVTADNLQATSFDIQKAGTVDNYITSTDAGGNVNLWFRDNPGTMNQTLGIEVQPSNGGKGVYISNRMEGGNFNFRTVPVSGSLQNSMILHASGYVTTPSQPGVNVAPLSTESGTYNNSANNNQYCIWSNIRWQIGNNYDTSNGTFTCPIAGRYYVSFHSNWYNSNAGTWIMPQVYVNGSNVEQWYHNTAGHGSWIQIQGATIINAAQNDTIRLYKQTQSGSGGGADVGAYSSFVVRLMG